MDAIIDVIRQGHEELLEQSEPITGSEKLLKSSVNNSFHIGGKLGFLNLETTLKKFLVAHLEEHLQNR